MCQRCDDFTTYAMQAEAAARQEAGECCCERWSATTESIWDSEGAGAAWPTTPERFQRVLSTVSCLNVTDNIGCWVLGLQAPVICS